jgi:hypothetical protein
MEPDPGEWDREQDEEWVVVVADEEWEADLVPDPVGIVSVRHVGMSLRMLLERLVIK